MLNKYLPQKDSEGNVLWDKPYIKNKEIKIKRMPIPYEKRKEYHKKYREANREKFREYARNFLRRKKLTIIQSMIKERIR